MKITVEKSLMPFRIPQVEKMRQLEQYGFPGYSYTFNELTGLSSDIDLESILSVARLGFEITGMELWFDIPNAKLTDPIPTEIADKFPVATYGDLTLYMESQPGFDKSIRYYQNFNNGVFDYMVVDSLQADGIDVLTAADLTILTNRPDYADITDPEYVAIETIEYIHNTWEYSYFFDVIHARLRMEEVYNDKGATANERWNACNDIEKQILVGWNIVGLNRASTIVDPAWSEARQLKAIGRLYRIYNLNVLVALEKRFNDWYLYLNMMLSGSGKTKFAADWDWGLKHQYMNRFSRQFEIGVTNDLLTWHDTVLSTYGDGDFVGSIGANGIVNNLRGVLTDKTYYI